MTEKRYENAAVIVSGAARGFGKMAAERFAAEGARLVLTDVLAEVETVAASIRDGGGEAVAIVADIAEEATARALVERCTATYGRLDIAINNAGIVHEGKKLPDIDSDTAERVIRVDLMAVFYAMKHQLPQMERQKSGVVLNVASVAGLVGSPTLSVYAAAKHGVVGMTKSAAAEYARSNIRINAICPSFTATNMVTDQLSTMRGSADEAIARTVAFIPMRRIARPEEIVQAMLWICSPENSFMTGHALAVDGGLSAL